MNVKTSMKCVSYTDDVTVNMLKAFLRYLCYAKLCLFYYVPMSYCNNPLCSIRMK